MTNGDDSALALPVEVCCRRPMTAIQVTAPLAQGSSTLALQTCSSCGRHVWSRDGQVLDRDAVLETVRNRIAEGPAPRLPRQRATRPSRARQ